MTVIIVPQCSWNEYSMDIVYVSNERKISAFATAALLLSILLLGGCATSAGSPSVMDARAEALAPSKTGAYLPVQDLPPKRDKPIMTPEERLRLQKELSVARDRQAPKDRGSAGSPQPIKP
jgi:hypothetical protein